MSQKILENKKLLLEVSPNMGASILRFIDKENKKNIFRSFPVKKRQGKYNCYFSGYFATIPYFGAIHKNTFFYIFRTRFVLIEFPFLNFRVLR